jgi:hypothetical protein
MSTADRYAIPVESLEWKLPENFESSFNWEYDDGSAALHRLYEKGKQQQWNATTRIDWSLDLDPENPEELPDEYLLEEMGARDQAVAEEFDAQRSAGAGRS